MDHISKAALYIRVSTEEQAAEGQSVDAQIDTLSQFCRLYHIDIYNIYQDLGISGKETHNRPGLIRMLEDGKQLKFNMVLVWKISRLSRSLKDLLLILDEFEKSNIIFNSYSEKFDTSTPLGKMTLQLLGSIAEFERNTIIDNVKLGLHEYANKGGKTGTVLGYDHHDKQLFVNPWEAEIIKMIYQLYTVNQMSMSEIAAYLNEAGYRTKRNNCFSKDGIATILSNPVYIGINRHN
ncbi:MAG: hin 4, partial [Clostridia bacterium]|nr:hin 4 [Clostridia bacterium]